MTKFLIVFLVFMCGCASVSEQWLLNPKTGEMEIVSKLVCRGSGCKADHKEAKVEGNTFLPPMPNLRIDQ